MTAAIVIWLAAIAAAVAWADVPAATWVRGHPLSQPARDVLNYARLPGKSFFFTLGVGVALGLWHRDRWRSALLLCGSAAFSGICVHLSKWIVGRKRPCVSIEGWLTIRPFNGGLFGWYGMESNLSFPSGDAALAFATAACLGIWFPKWRPAFYAWAAIVAAQRVLTNSHFVSETIAGAAVGVLSVWIGRRVYAAFATTALKAYHE